MGTDEAVGVVLLRQKKELDAAHIGGIGQGGVQRLTRRAAARAVTVKTEHHRVGKPEQFVHVVGRAGSAQRRHRVGKAQLC